MSLYLCSQFSGYPLISFVSVFFPTHLCICGLSYLCSGRIHSASLRGLTSPCIVRVFSLTDVCVCLLPLLVTDSLFQQSFTCNSLCYWHSSFYGSSGKMKFVYITNLVSPETRQVSYKLHLQENHVSYCWHPTHKTCSLQILTFATILDNYFPFCYSCREFVFSFYLCYETLAFICPSYFSLCLFPYHCSLDEQMSC